MDSSFGQQLQQNQQLPLDSLSARDKQELQQDLNNELQKANIQESVHNLTNICWKKCVTGKIGQGQLTSSEAPCMQNCVDRFLDANEAILRHLTTLRGKGDISE